MKYFDDEDEDDEEEKKINDKFDDIYDDLILKKGEQNNKERSFQYHGNEDGDLSGIYLQEDEENGGRVSAPGGYGGCHYCSGLFLRLTASGYQGSRQDRRSGCEAYHQRAYRGSTCLRS